MLKKKNILHWCTALVAVHFIFYVLSSSCCILERSCSDSSNQHKHSQFCGVKIIAYNFLLSGLSNTPKRQNENYTDYLILTKKKAVIESITHEKSIRIADRPGFTCYDYPPKLSFKYSPCELHQTSRTGFLSLASGLSPPVV